MQVQHRPSRKVRGQRRRGRTLHRQVVAPEVAFLERGLGPGCSSALSLELTDDVPDQLRIDYGTARARLVGGERVGEA